MNELVATIVVILFAVLVLVATSRGYSRLEQQLMTVSLGGHVAAAFAQIWITRGVYESGDLTTYFAQGSMLARAIEINPSRFGEYWVNLLLQRDAYEPLQIMGAGNSTGSMMAIAAGLALVTRYSIYGSCLAVAVAACFGKFALYRVFRESIPVEARTKAMVALLLVPSVVFWSSALLKESVVIAAIGPVWLGVHRLLRGRWIRGALFVAIGVFPISILKAYTLFPLACAAAVWVGVDRIHASQGRRGPIKIKPHYIVLSAVLAFAGVIALGRIFPIYSVENLGDDLARHQRLGVMAGGGSYYEMGDETAMSLQRQIAFAPLGLATALFRPFLFEARNALALVAALETTVITVLLVRTLVRASPAVAVRNLMSRPILVVSLVFAMSLGMAVGMATTNFGSLSRYRMPLVPFYASVVLLLGVPAAARAPARPVTPARAPLPQHRALVARTRHPDSRLRRHARS